MQISEHIIFQTQQFVIANKPAGVPMQPDKTGDKSLMDLLEIYCKSTLFVVHRLDRPVSGVVILAKNKKAAANLSKQFQGKTVQKKYLAVVKDAPAEAEGTLIHYLKKVGKQEKIFDVPTEGALESQLFYKKLSASDKYHLLEITPATGRFHQIRAQLSGIGSPIKGDVKYGFRRGNEDRSIHLHSWKLTFEHPVSNQTMHFEAPLPEDTLWKVLYDGIA